MHLLRVIILLSCLSQAAVAADIWATLFLDNQARAEQGDANGQYETGIMFLKGQGVAADRVMGLNWLEKSASQGHEKAKRKLTREKKNSNKFNGLVKKAENGNAVSQYEVAMMLNSGRGVNLDQEQALNWFSVAADQGHKKSVVQKAIILFKGEGVKRDPKYAVNLFLSVSDTEVVAQYYLGDAYANGDGVSRDLDAAWSWYRQAADGGFGRAEGKAINVEEEINMERQRASRSRQRKSKITAPTLISEPESASIAPVRITKPKVKRVSKNINKPVKKRKVKKAFKPVTKPVTSIVKPISVTRVVGMRANQGYTLEHLLNKNWTAKGKSTTFLPSSLNDCVPKDKKLICLSHQIENQRAGSIIRYKVKSIISKAYGSSDRFSVSYKNLVLDVAQLDKDESDGNTSEGFHVKTGWTRKHVAECTFRSSEAIHCIKNGIHKIDVRARSY